MLIKAFLYSWLSKDLIFIKLQQLISLLINMIKFRDLDSKITGNKKLLVFYINCHFKMSTENLEGKMLLVDSVDCYWYNCLLFASKAKIILY